ncbi:MAG: hypothetical protein AAF191_11160 [Verrucomicrobiota bacterium]
MNHSEIETAYAKFTRELLLVDGLSGKISGVFEGLNADSLDPYNSMVVVSSQEGNNLIQDLNEGNIFFIVSTPSRVKGITIEDHQALVKSIRGSFGSSLFPARALAIAANSCYRLCGDHYEDSTASTEDGYWVTTLILRAALQDQDPFQPGDGELSAAVAAGSFGRWRIGDEGQGGDQEKTLSMVIPPGDRQVFVNLSEVNVFTYDPQTGNEISTFIPGAVGVFNSAGKTPEEKRIKIPPRGFAVAGYGHTSHTGIVIIEEW